LKSVGSSATISREGSLVTDRHHRVRGELEHLRHRQRDLLARLELAKERLALFPTEMAKHQVALLSAQQDELAGQLAQAAQVLGDA
jgi:hypothetical protein